MSDKIRFGPANPHPLSQLKTELVWDGKYDEYGNRRVVDIAGCAMPMQKIETIDEPRSRAAAEGQIELFEETRGASRGLNRVPGRLLSFLGINRRAFHSVTNLTEGRIQIGYLP